MTAFKKRKIDDQCNASRRVASRSTTRRARALERRGRGRDERLDERRRTSSRTRVSRDGVPETRGIWHDTVLVRPEERVEVAFVADNPGDWLFHCHVPEHMMAGMTGMFRVG